MKKWILALSLSVTACGYKHTGLPGDSAANGPLGQGSSLSFTSVKAQVFQPYCIRCHSQAGGNKAGINLETYARVKPIITRVKAAVNTNFMPQSGPLNDTSKAILNAWADAGAPETATTSPTPVGDQNPPPPDPDDDDDDHDDDDDDDIQ